MKDLLIVVSTYNRRDLTGVTLDALSQTMSPCSDVIILDDASTEYDIDWLQRWGFRVYRRFATAGVGEAARQRFLSFIVAARQYRYACLLDNDLMFVPAFDQRLRELWLRVSASHKSNVILTGYRSNTQTVVATPQPDWVETETIGGACQFIDREAAYQVITRMPAIWPHAWDALISKVGMRFVAPKCSWIEHLGVHGGGVNGISTDRAVLFGHNL